MFIENKTANNTARKKKEYTRGDNKIHDKICKHDSTNNNGGFRKQQYGMVFEQISTDAGQAQHTTTHNLQDNGLISSPPPATVVSLWTFFSLFIYLFIYFLVTLFFLIIEFFGVIRIRPNINFNAHTQSTWSITCFLLSFDQFSIPHLTPLLIIQSK